jgi:hypothetical protein
MADITHAFVFLLSQPDMYGKNTITRNQLISFFDKDIGRRIANCTPDLVAAVYLAGNEKWITQKFIGQFDLVA